VVVVGEWDGMDMSTLSILLVRCGGCPLGRANGFGQHGRYPPGCFVGAGMRLGAITGDSGSAVAV
jgi:hypothetical protein